MRKIIWVATTVLILAFSSNPNAGTPMWVKFDDAELRLVLQALQTACGEKVALAVNVDPSVKLTMDAGNLGCEQAFNAVTSEAGLTYERPGDFLVVYKDPVEERPSNSYKAPG